ncbi:MAG TPA: hypothetical protein VMU94_23645 [Streptosporangiaceae bacterium]|nr:hypothetical protein [Streptosporangiaceae bacterium]
MAELISDLFVTLDGFAGGVNAGPFFGYGGPELDTWVRDTLDQPQLVVMGRVSYEAMTALASFGIRVQIVSSSGAGVKRGVVSPQLGQIWPAMFSTPPRMTARPRSSSCSNRCASRCATSCGVMTSSASVVQRAS